MWPIGESCIIQSCSSVVAFGRVVHVEVANAIILENIFLKMKGRPSYSAYPLHAQGCMGISRLSTKLLDRSTLLQFVLLRVGHIYRYPTTMSVMAYIEGVGIPLSIHCVSRGLYPADLGAYKGASCPRVPMTDPASANTRAITRPE